MRRLYLLTALWLLTLLLLSRYALAATLQVAPVTLDLDSSQRATAVYLTNSGDTPIHAQIRVYDWTQANGKDVLTPTDDVVSSPAMTALAPGQQQLVRIIVLQPGARPQEQSYRLVIDELPSHLANAAGRNAVHFLLRYSIPVFIAGAHGTGSRETDLSCEQTDSPAAIQCYNAGDRHIRLSNLQTLTPEGQVVDTMKGLAGYVLPGQKYVFTLKHTPRRALASLRVFLNENRHASQISLGAASARPSGIAPADANGAR
ncbi:fimbrial biogenesis chaperone [Enterobacter huaxiensis]|uniref:fimbrial biogenesis chaperone n=1 Tax=Enterobacter huaxiensis TaxID=2494702 RepID=UPI000E73F36D|nr:fimbria/pilus periplasmic chaperone [Enterobacter huaxiensis]UNC51744.1 molecular chaperone [Enterobacter huaxiensis]